LPENLWKHKETPLTGNAVQDSNGSYLYSLQRIVDDNRINKRITYVLLAGMDKNN
jgi:mannan endo-1,4-beta-mannosidase